MRGSELGLRTPVGPPLKRGGSRVGRWSTCVHLAGRAGRGPWGPTGAFYSGPMGGVGREEVTPERGISWI